MGTRGITIAFSLDQDVSRRAVLSRACGSRTGVFALLLVGAQHGSHEIDVNCFSYSGGGGRAWNVRVARRTELANSCRWSNDHGGDWVYRSEADERKGCLLKAGLRTFKTTL